MRRCNKARSLQNTLKKTPSRGSLISTYSIFCGEKEKGQVSLGSVGSAGSSVLLTRFIGYLSSSFSVAINFQYSKSSILKTIPIFEKHDRFMLFLKAMSFSTLRNLSSPFKLGHASCIVKGEASIDLSNR